LTAEQLTGARRLGGSVYLAAITMSGMVLAVVPAFRARPG
jgi:hypothetical protein